ncbi:MAG TPA: 3,4-dihydroxy-2-butanone-4-phosphate synthase [Dehalococcoidia bacterium]|nr:3,4-dihydroxy-2-butanone-4-phosphate synthase [Dehalococcoidia bacterium]
MTTHRSLWIIDVPQAAQLYAQGRPVLIVDDEDRENEGDVVIAAQFCTPEWINFMAVHARGLICAPIDNATADRLALPPMVAENEASLGTAFTVSVEARHGVTTGISAADRSRTVQLLADPGTTAQDLVRPGHIFPLRARDGGVLERDGQTEASVDLCTLAGLQSVAVICEVINDDGQMARMPDLELFAERHDLRIVSVAAIQEHRRAAERTLAACPSGA